MRSLVHSRSAAEEEEQHESDENDCERATRLGKASSGERTEGEQQQQKQRGEDILHLLVSDASTHHQRGDNHPNELADNPSLILHPLDLVLVAVALLLSISVVPLRTQSRYFS